MLDHKTQVFVCRILELRDPRMIFTLEVIKYGSDKSEASLRLVFSYFVVIDYRISFTVELTSWRLIELFVFLQIFTFFFFCYFFIM